MQTDSSARRELKYKRIILKLSGEVLKNPESGDPIDPEILLRICNQLKEIWDFGMEIGVVVGGGNIFRGLQGEGKGVARTTGDYMGMLATVINSMAIMDCLEKLGVVTRVLYDKDPMNHKDAKKFHELTYMDCLNQRLKVMDSTAFSLCMDNGVPILVIDLNDPAAIKKAVTGDTIGTLVHT